MNPKSYKSYRSYSSYSSYSVFPAIALKNSTSGR